MSQYQVGKSWFFPQLGRKPEPGEVIELEDGVAEHYMHNEPGLLTPVHHTAQATPTVVRSAEPKKKGTRAKK